MRAAIVGLGAIAPVHAAGILRAGGEIAAVCDILPGRAETFRAAHAPSAAVYSDFGEMLAAGGFDAVHICTPHDLHAPMSVAALDAGYHVLVEKPRGISGRECGEVRRAAERARGVIGVCHQNRWNEGTARAASALKENPPFAGFGSVVWKRDAAYYRSADWRGRKAREGGGVLINQALHTLDLLIYLMGMPDTVLARAHNDSHAGVIDTEDTADCFFEGKDFSFHFYATTASAADFPPLAEIAAPGITVTLSGSFYAENGRSARTDGGVCPGKEVWGDGHAKLIRDFYAAAGGGPAFPVDAEEGSKVVRAILAVYRSRGRKIKIK